MNTLITSITLYFFGKVKDIPKVLINHRNDLGQQLLKLYALMRILP